VALTSEDVAQRAGVSRSTVSYILNGQGHRFSASTREAVERAVAELGYRPQSAGRTLVRGQSDLVLLILPIAASGRMNEFVNALTESLSRKGLSLLMTSASTPSESFEAMISAVRPRAVVALSDLSDAERKILEVSGVRTLEVARDSARPGGTNWDAGRMQAQHLIEKGFKRIAYVRLAEARDDILMAAREQGVRDACLSAGLTAPRTFSVALRADADLKTMKAIASGTGLACYNDETAAAALSAAIAIGRHVPQDLGIVGMDNSPVATQTKPPLTTIDVDLMAGAKIVSAALTDEKEFEDPPFPDIQIVQGGTT
jgi:DNA-binding LacI/PurR family transcriptional regulator